MHEELFQLNKRALLDALKAAGAARATIAYEGSGDSGDITSCQIFDNMGAEIVVTGDIEVHSLSCEYKGKERVFLRLTQTMPLEDALRDLADDVLETRFGGWENNDGADGQVDFDVETESVRIEHRAYFMDSDLTEIDL